MVELTTAVAAPGSTAPEPPAERAPRLCADPLLTVEQLAVENAALAAMTLGLLRELRGSTAIALVPGDGRIASFDDVSARTEIVTAAPAAVAPAVDAAPPRTFRQRTSDALAARAAENAAADAARRTAAPAVTPLLTVDEFQRTIKTLLGDQVRIPARTTWRRVPESE